jgi:hypothetical protein
MKKLTKSSVQYVLFIYPTYDYIDPWHTLIIHGIDITCGTILSTVGVEIWSSHLKATGSLPCNSWVHKSTVWVLMSKSGSLVKYWDPQFKEKASACESLKKWIWLFRKRIISLTLIVICYKSQKIIPTLVWMLHCTQLQIYTNAILSKYFQSNKWA